MADKNATTLSASIAATDQQPTLASLSTLAVGDVLVIDREAMAVVRLSPLRVMRGALSTAAVAHAGGATVYTGSPALFARVDPVGIPSADASSPWINLATGNVWVAQGDQVGPGVNTRYWQLQTTTRTAGALGVRVATVSP